MIDKNIGIDKNAFFSFVELFKFQCFPPVVSYSERIFSKGKWAPLIIPEVSFVKLGLSILNRPLLKTLSFFLFTIASSVLLYITFHLLILRIPQLEDNVKKNSCQAIRKFNTLCIQLKTGGVVEKDN